MQNLTVSRRTALLGVAATAVLPSVLRAQSLEKVRVSIIPVYDVAPLYAAIVKGYFKELGIDVETAPTAGGAAGIPGLIGGSVERFGRGPRDPRWTMEGDHHLLPLQRPGLAVF